MNFLAVVAMLIPALSLFAQPLHATPLAPAAVVDHYYESLLGRAPTPAESVRWDADVARLAAQGHDPREILVSVATELANGAAYRDLRRDDVAFVADMHRTFLLREPAPGESAAWGAQLAAGVPRSAVLAQFQSMPVYRAWLGREVPTAEARADVTLLLELYRGYLARLPEDDGLGKWTGRLRDAACRGVEAMHVEIEAITAGFQDSKEYRARARSDAEFVGDLFATYVRREVAVADVLALVRQREAGASRAGLRQAFMASPDFQATLEALAEEGCLRSSARLH